MGRMLGCFGHVSQLRRIAVAPFDERLGVTQEHLSAAAQKVAENMENHPALAVLSPEANQPLDLLLKPAEAALVSLAHVALGDDAAQRIRMGNPAIVRGRDAPVESDAAYVTNKGKLLAIGEIRFGEFHPKRVFK
jgi:tRNA pseudouridine55 synthase